MKQHTIKIENYTHCFEEIDDTSNIVLGGVQINGQANTVTEFIQNIRLEQQWIPYGYFLKTVFRIPNSKNMTAYLYRH